MNSKVTERQETTEGFDQRSALAAKWSADITEHEMKLEGQPAGNGGWRLDQTGNRAARKDHWYFG